MSALLLQPKAQKTVDRSGGRVKGTAAAGIEYPCDESIFPPGMSAPRFIWHDASRSDSWRVTISFGDGSDTIEVTVAGEHLKVGPIDDRCIAPTNKLPQLTAEQAELAVAQGDSNLQRMIAGRIALYRGRRAYRN